MSGNPFAALCPCKFCVLNNQLQASLWGVSLLLRTVLIFVGSQWTAHARATCLYAVRAASFEWRVTSVCRRGPTVVAYRVLGMPDRMQWILFVLKWPVWNTHDNSMQNPANARLQPQFPQRTLPLIRSYTIYSFKGHVDLTNSLTVPDGNMNWLGNKARWNKHNSNTLEVLPSLNTAVLFMHYLMRIYFHSYSKRALNICNSEHSLLQVE